MRRQIVGWPIDIERKESDFSLYKKLRRKYDINIFMKSDSLKSSTGDRYTIMVFKASKRYLIKNDAIEVTEANGTSEEYRGVEPFDLIREKSMKGELKNEDQYDIPFKGGIVGYLTYDYYHLFLNKGIALKEKDSIQIPAGILLCVDDFLLYNSEKKTLTLYSVIEKGQSHALGERAASEIATAIRSSKEDAFLKYLERCKVVGEIPNYRSNMNRDAYAKMIEESKGYLRRGEIHQIVLSQRFRIGFDTDGFYLFYFLNKINPSRYMYFLDFAEFQIISSSPETHCRCKDKSLELNILGGTQRRGRDGDEDERIRQDLKSSGVSRTEHLMLVQSDKKAFGVVAQAKSLKVKKRLSTVKYGYTQYLSTNMTAKLKRKYDIFDVLKLTFPRGIVVGTPREKAMELISKLEPERRSFYAGIMLWSNYNRRDMDAAVTIITSLLKNRILYTQCGGGIIEDSDTEQEFQATIYKSMAHAKAAFSVRKALMRYKSKHHG